MTASNADVAVAYHHRTKHHLQRYAAGPETLDWDAQPDPFRRFVGAPLRHLPLAADTLATPWSAVCDGTALAQPVSLSTLGMFFELSFALTAWKQQGPDRWALRANPSSGNLHPTEAYVVAHHLYGLEDGVYHYAPREHALELRGTRAQPLSAVPGAPALWLGLSSIHWREAWKYGERAFRYCQLDTGHALGAVRYAAAALGWQARLVAVGHADIAQLLGLDRAADFGTAEPEDAELLLQIGPALPPVAEPPPWAVGTWHGRANRLDAHPMYRWQVIDEVAVATRLAAPGRTAVSTSTASATSAVAPLLAPRHAEAAATLIRGRRSAQHFDRRARMTADAWWRIARAVLPEAGLPWDAWPLPAGVHLVAWLHRVDGIEPGAYLLPRDAQALPALQAALHTGQTWARVDSALHTPNMPNAPSTHAWRMASHPALAGTLRTLSCHQAIASDACVAFSLLADRSDASAPRYRELLQEAGLIGQVLYLQAEAEGLRGTGIGCYFDDAVHELLGLASTPDARWQVLYHFTIGAPVVDARITTEPPYWRPQPRCRSVPPGPMRGPYVALGPPTDGPAKPDPWWRTG